MLGSENGAGVEEPTLFSEDDTLFSSFASPVQPLKDDCIISDHMLHDLMPDLSTQSMEECLNLSKYPVQMSIDECNYYPFDLVCTPEHDNMSSDATRAFCAHDQLLHLD